MSYSINQALLVGNVSKDPEVRFTPSNQAVCNFTVATNRGVKKNDVWENVPTFHKIVVWGKLAEQLATSLQKGKKVTILGRIENRSYEDKQGVKKYISEIVADSVIFDQPRDSAPQRQSEPSEPTGQEPQDVEDVSDQIPF